MQQIKTIILAILVTTSMHIKTHETPHELIDDRQSLSDNLQSDTIIVFTTKNDDHPSGEYWPSSQIVVLGLDGKAINSSSAYIGDLAYSNISEEKNLQPDRESHYLGYFIDTKSHETIYLYGIKDKKIANDANEETISNADEEEDDDNEDEDFEDN